MHTPKVMDTPGLFSYKDDDEQSANQEDYLGSGALGNSYIGQIKTGRKITFKAGQIQQRSFTQRYSQKRNINFMK
jgi:hypothetical protein